jgi:hypothetical protein
MCTLLAALAAATAWVMLTVRPVEPGVAASAPAPPAVVAAPQALELSAVGTLEQIDLATMQIVVATASGKLTFRVPSGATIRQGSRKMNPAALAAHKGERVKVRYREAGGVRRAEWIVLAPGLPRAAKRS